MSNLEWSTEAQAYLFAATIADITTGTSKTTYGIIRAVSHYEATEIAKQGFLDLHGVEPGSVNVSMVTFSQIDALNRLVTPQEITDHD